MSVFVFIASISTALSTGLIWFPIVFVTRKELKTMGMEVNMETDSVIMDE